MNDKRRNSRRIADIIRHYEEMEAADIEAELLRAGVDPRPTIDAVTKLVHQRLEEWRSRGGLHRKGTKAA